MGAAAPPLESHCHPAVRHGRGLDWDGGYKDGEKLSVSLLRGLDGRFTPNFGFYLISLLGGLEKLFGWTHRGPEQIWAPPS